MGAPDTDGSRALAPVATADPPAGASKPSAPPWIARVTKQIMDSDTAHRMQAAVGSQIPPLVAAIGGALSRLSEPQRHWIADDLVRDLQHIEKVCEPLSKTENLSNPAQVIAAIGKLEYVAERLATCYGTYTRQLGQAVPQLMIHPLSREEHVVIERWLREKSPEEAQRFGNRHIADRATKTSEAITKILSDLQEKNDKGELVTKRVIHADELTFALGELAALAESVYQELRAMYIEVWKASQTMRRRFMEQMRGFRQSRSSKQQPKK